MNKDIFLNEQDAKLKKKLLYITLFAVYAAYAVNSCVISPIYTVTSSDITLEKLSFGFYFLGVIIDIFTIFLSLSIVIYGMCRISLRNLRSVIILTLAAPFVKNLLKLAVSPIIDGMPSINQFLIDIYSLSLSSLLEILQLAVVIFIAYIPIKKYRQKLFSLRESKSNDDRRMALNMRLIPFKSLLDLKNPLQAGAFISTFIIIAIRLLMWIINDLSMVSVNFDFMFFLPYVLEIIGGIIGYLFMLYIYMLIGSKDSDI